MELNLDRVRRNVQAATTEDLLDRLTVYREGMEEEAIEIIVAELDRRGVDDERIRTHAAMRGQVLMNGDVAARCSYCDRPAIAHRWGLRRMFNVVPLLPWRFRVCQVHADPVKSS